MRKKKFTRIALSIRENAEARLTGRLGLVTNDGSPKDYDLFNSVISGSWPKVVFAGINRICKFQ